MLGQQEEIRSPERERKKSTMLKLGQEEKRNGAFLLVKWALVMQ